MKKNEKSQRKFLKVKNIIKVVMYSEIFIDRVVEYLKTLNFDRWGCYKSSMCEKLYLRMRIVKIELLCESSW